jgi:hypothetical protein
MMELITKYFTSDNDAGGIENATHNTFTKLTWITKRMPSMSKFMKLHSCFLNKKNKTSMLTLEMYFQFRRAHNHS